MTSILLLAPVLLALQSGKPAVAPPTPAVDLPKIPLSDAQRAVFGDDLFERRFA